MPSLYKKIFVSVLCLLLVSGALYMIIAHTLIRKDPSDRLDSSYSNAPLKIVKTIERGIAAGGGLQYQSDVQREIYFDALDKIGASWIRFDFAWSDIQSGGPEQYNWGKYDAVVSEAKKRDIKVLGLLAYTPDWARPTACKTDDKCAPDGTSTYSAFVSKAVNRYKSRGVSHWEIWNEPNNSVFWKPQPNAQDYAKLLKDSYKAVKNADASAQVISGGLSPATNENGNIAPLDFLRILYANNARGSFDALGYHPYCYFKDFQCPGQYAPWSAWSQMSETPVSVRSIMKNNNDASKNVWITEFGAPTRGENAVTEALQANIVKTSYDHFGQYEWAGPLFWYSLQDNGVDKADVEDWFGLIDKNGTKKSSFVEYSRNAHEE